MAIRHSEQWAQDGGRHHLEPKQRFGTIEGRAFDDPLQTIAVERLLPPKDNPRETFGDVAALAASIRTYGVLQPLVVVEEQPAGYRIVCGERRWRAALSIGLSRLPCHVRDFDEGQCQEAMLVENLQRRTLRPIEEARAYERLIKLGHRQTDIAERVGRSQGHVSRRLALLELPAEDQRRVDRHELRINQALGYEPTPPVDVFDADERLQVAWMALRQEVIERGDQRLTRLLVDFARAYVQRIGFTVQVKPPPVKAKLSRSL